MTPVRSLGRPRWLDISVALASLSACTGAPAPSPSGPAPGAAPSSPAPDPRTGLAPGLFDAGEAIWNMRRVSSTRPPQEFVGSTNSDLAFTGDYVIQGNYNGIQIWDVVDPARPSLAAQYVCPASQSDVSVHGRLLFVSGEGLEGRLDCGREPPRPAASPERLRGIRIFDISDIRSPRYIANVQTCRGSHTHTLLQDPDDDENIYLYVSGSAPVRPAAELAGCSGAPPERDPTSALFRIEVIRVPLANPERAEIVSSPRIFADLAAPPTHGLAPAELAEVEAARARGAFVLEMAGQVQVMPDAVATMMLDTMVARRGGAGPPTAQDSASLRETLAQMTRMTASLPAGARPGPTQCHDITVYPAIGLAAGACEGYGFLLDITDPVNPRRIDAVSDSSFAYWHSATIDNEGTQVLFTDEWGGGAQPKCRASDPREWGADAIFSLEERRMRFRGYYKLPAAQPETENCVAHNGSLIPIPGRDVMVQAWYQGGISVFDWTDPERPVEIAYFDRGAANPAGRGMAGTWSAYWYNGHVVSSEISRGLDILELAPSEMLSQNEIDAAASVLVDELNAQSQRPFVWPATFALAGAYLDQLERSGGLAPARLASARAALDGAARDPGTAALAALGRLASDVSGAAGGSSEPEKVALLASTLRELASMTPAELVAAAPRTAPLIPETPAGSPVVDVRTYAENVTRWTLGNGVQILLKPTDFQTGQVILVGFSPGGGALADDQDLGSARAAASVVGRSGLGAFTGPALRRRIAGRNVSVAPVMNEWREGIRGVAPPAELETLFQLVYLSFTAPRADERTLERWRSDQLRLRASRESTAAADFNDRWTRLRAAGPASEPLTADAVASADLERALAFYRDRFADASDFVFNLVGDFDPDDVRPLIERYLGGLPSIGRREAPPLPALPQALVDVTETTTVHAGANTRIHFSGPYEAGSARSRAELGALAIILQARLRARVGPGLGDGYFISARWATRLEPTPTYDLLVDFGSEAEPVEELVARVMDEVARLSSEPPTDGEIADARGRLGRPHDATVRQNGFWSNMLRAAEIEGVDPVAEIVGYPDALDALSSASLAEAARVLLARSRSTRLSVRLDPSVEAPWIAGAEFRARFDAENQGGFYAARIEGRFLDGRYEFRASFAPDPAGSSWQVYWGLDEAAFATRDREFTAQGFRRVWTQDFTDARGRRLTQATWMRLAP